MLALHNSSSLRNPVCVEANATFLQSDIAAVASIFVLLGLAWMPGILLSLDVFMNELAAIVLQYVFVILIASQVRVRLHLFYFSFLISHF